MVVVLNLDSRKHNDHKTWFWSFFIESGFHYTVPLIIVSILYHMMYCFCNYTTLQLLSYYNLHSFNIKENIKHNWSQVCSWKCYISKCYLGQDWIIGIQLSLYIIWHIWHLLWWYKCIHSCPMSWNSICLCLALSRNF